jgi:hypothetical protein
MGSMSTTPFTFFFRQLFSAIFPADRGAPGSWPSLDSFPSKMKSVAVALLAGLK